MKKIILILLISLFLVSCAEQSDDNEQYIVDGISINGGYTGALYTISYNETRQDESSAIFIIAIGSYSDRTTYIYSYEFLVEVDGYYQKMKVEENDWNIIMFKFDNSVEPNVTIFPKFDKDSIQIGVVYRFTIPEDSVTNIYNIGFD